MNPQAGLPSPAADGEALHTSRSLGALFSLTCFALIAGMGLTVMFGWYFQWPAVVQLHPSFVPMQFNTALGFLVAGLAGLALERGVGRWAFAGGAFMALLGGITLLQYVFGVSFGIDELLMHHDITVRTSHPGRMAPSTATCFVLSGLALAARVKSATGTDDKLSAVLAALVLSLALVAGVGYLSGVTSTYTWGQLTAMAVHTALAFSLFSSAFLLSQWRLSQEWLPAWCPAVFGLIVFSLSVQLWQGLHSSEQAARQAELTEKGAHIAELLEFYILGITGDLRTIGRTTSALNADASVVAWSAQATELAAEYPGIEALLLSDGSGAELASVPALHAFEGVRGAAPRSPELGCTLRPAIGEAVDDGLVLRVDVATPFAAARCGTTTAFIRISAVVSRLTGPSQEPLGLTLDTDLREGSDTVNAFERRVRLAGTTFLLRAAGTGNPDPAGSLGALLVLVFGITTATLLAATVTMLRRDREHVQQLRAANQATGERLDLATEGADLGTWQWDIVSNTMTWSAHAMTLLDLPPNTEMSVDRYVEALWPDVQDDIRASISDASVYGGHYQAEHPVRLADGRMRWLAAFGRVQFNDEGEAVRMDGILQDIDARKNAEIALLQKNDALERSNRDLERFAYVASHDLQEPLRMVASFLQLLKERYQGQLDADADEFIGFAVDGARRMKRMIQGLLSISRIGDASRLPAPCDMNVVVQQATTNLSGLLEEARAIVTYDTLPVVNGDMEDLAILMSNLIENAITHGGKTAVQVHVAAETITRDGLRIGEDAFGNGWLFSIRDNGIGIDAAHLERIFEIFRRINLDAEQQRSGVGLAMCRKIVEHHGGNIWAESTGTTAGGSVFYFTLPAALDVFNLQVSNDSYRKGAEVA